MNFYIKQHVFTWGDRFSIYDANGNEIFYVKGEVFSFGKQLRLYDLSDNELVYIEQKVFSFFPKFFIYRNGTQVADVAGKFRFFKQEYFVNGLDWQVFGDFTGHCYEVSDCGMSIASVSKEWFSWGDAYEISVADGIDEINALAVVLVIDAIIDVQNNG